MSQSTEMVNAPAHSLTASPPISTQTPSSSPPAKPVSPRKQYQRFRTPLTTVRISRVVLLVTASIAVPVILAYCGNTLSLNGNVMSQDAAELAKWTVEGDLHEVFLLAKGKPSYTPEDDNVFFPPFNPPSNHQAANTSQPEHHNHHTVLFISNPAHTDTPFSRVSLTKALSIILAIGMLRICLRTRHEFLRRSQKLSQRALERSLLLFDVLFLGILKPCVTVLILALLTVPLLLICGYVYISFLILEGIAECVVVRPMMSKAQKTDAARLTMLVSGIIIALRLCFALPCALVQVAGRWKVEDRQVGRQSAVAREYLARELEAFLEGSTNAFRYGEPFCSGS
ncbi:hypothetical protein BDD12DRAFT_837892 [Trichophaea hybrida]|nr:hypothetical protein BDD12DRAFT_837892 [Trichophaea hybrida]